MIVAMDWHGSLESLPTLLELAGVLADGGAQVHVISAVGNNSQEETIRRRILDMGGGFFRGVHFVYFPRPLERGGAVEREIGKLKAGVMRNVGAAILFDDNPYICDAVRDDGLLACQLKGKPGR